MVADVIHAHDAHVKPGAVLKQYKLLGVFPTDISAVPLDFGTNDQLSSFSATFQYQTFEFTNTPAGQLINAITSLGSSVSA